MIVWPFRSLLSLTALYTWAGLQEEAGTGGVWKRRGSRMTIMLDHLGGGCDVERVEREVASVIPRKPT